MIFGYLDRSEAIILPIFAITQEKRGLKIAYTTGKHTKSLDSDNNATPASAEFKVIVDGLEGFTEQKPGLWIRPLGEVRNLAQAKRLIKPIWDVVYNAIAPFGEAW